MSAWRRSAVSIQHTIMLQRTGAANNPQDDGQANKEMYRQAQQNGNEK